MTSQEKKELRTCTKQGLIDLIRNPRYTQNKVNQFPAIVGYLARHGLPGGTSKEDFLDLVYTARNELIAQAAEAHANANQPMDYNAIPGLQGAALNRVKAFLRDPVASIEAELRAFHDRKENFEQMEDPDEVQYYVDLKTNADIHVIELGATGQTDRIKYDHNPEMIDILGRLSKKLPEEDASIDASLKRINSGFFGTLFRRRSKEYAAFERSFKEFRDVKWAHSGNVEDLEKKTTAYLQHVIPNFKYSKDMPREQWLAALPKGKRNRAEFCMNVLDSIDEHKKMKPYMDNVENAINGKPVKNIVEEPAIQNDIAEQKQFQQSLEQAVEPKEKKEDIVVEEEEPKVESNDIQIQ